MGRKNTAKRRRDAKEAARQEAASNVQPVLDELQERASRAYGHHVESWLACGKVLLEARTIARHGQWLIFLNSAGIPRRTAQRMMKVVKWAGDDAAKCDTVSFLGVKDALDWIRLQEKAMAAWRRRCADTKLDDAMRARITQNPPDLLTGIHYVTEADDKLKLQLLTLRFVLRGQPDLLESFLDTCRENNQVRGQGPAARDEAWRVLLELALRSKQAPESC